MAKKSKQDDLTAIKGIGPAYQAKLHQAEIRTYAQLASKSVSELNEILDRDVADSRWLKTAKRLDAEQKTSLPSGNLDKVRGKAKATRKRRSRRKKPKTKAKYTIADCETPVRGTKQKLPDFGKRQRPRILKTESLTVSEPSKRDLLEQQGELLREKHPSVIGFDVVDSGRGKKREGPRLKVYVKRKTKAVQETIASEHIPIDETDVDIEIDEFEPFDLASAVTVSGGDKTNADFAPQRPGTVGVLVKVPINGIDFRFLLTAAHVVRGTASSVGARCPVKMQKSGKDYGKARCNVPNFRFWEESSRVDAALVFPSQSTITTRFVTPPTTVQKVPYKFRAPVPSDINSSVKIWKRGMNGTGFGNIKKISASRPLTPSPGNPVADVTNHILIERTSGHFAGGDSGAAIVLQDSIIGLLRAVNRSQTQILACRIDEVVSRLVPFDMYTSTG